MPCSGAGFVKKLAVDASEGDVHQANKQTVAHITGQSVRYKFPYRNTYFIWNSTCFPFVVPKGFKRFTMISLPVSDTMLFFVLRRRRQLISFSVPGLVWNSLQILLKVLSTRPPGTCGPVAEKSMLCLKLVSKSHQMFKPLRKHKANKCWISNEIYDSVRKFIPDRFPRNVCYCLLVGLMGVTFRSIYSEFLHKPGPTESQ